METLQGLGVRELSWSGGGDDAAWQESLRFAAQNFHIVRERWGRSIHEISDARVRAYTVEGFTLLHSVARGDTGTVSLEIRDDASIAQDRRDRLVFVLQLKGVRKFSQFGRSQYLGEGESTIYCTSEPYVIETDAWSGALEMICFLMPGEFVKRRIIDCKQYCLRESTTKLRNLASGTVKLFNLDAWSFDKHEFYKSAAAISELVLGSLDNATMTVPRESSVRASNIARVKGIIRRRLADPDLTLTDIADEAGISRNYLHKLFRDEGRSVSDYLKAERLQRAREMLSGTAARGMKVTDVSLSCGFSDSSYFSRTFKQAFGIRPTDAMRGR